jgi:hypothetical protein
MFNKQPLSPEKSSVRGEGIEHAGSLPSWVRSRASKPETVLRFEHPSMNQQRIDGDPTHGRQNESPSSQTKNVESGNQEDRSPKADWWVTTQPTAGGSVVRRQWDAL